MPHACLRSKTTGIFCSATQQITFKWLIEPGIHQNVLVIENMLIPTVAYIWKISDRMNIS